MRKSILLVEDDQDIRDAISELLEFEGYHVTSCANGQEGLDQLQALSPSPALILLDLMMPKVNGWQFVAEKNLFAEPLANIPVFVISADNALQKKAEELKVAGYLRKPLEIEALLASIRKFVD